MNQLNQIQKKKFEGDTHNLLDLTPNHPQTHALQETIQNNGGELFALVHPFYELKEKMDARTWVELILILRDTTPISAKLLEKRINGIYNSARHKGNIVRYLFKLRKYIQRHSHDILLLAEETELVEETEYILRTIGFHGPLIFYPTMPSNPEPDIQTANTFRERIRESLATFFDEQAALYRSTPEYIRKRKWQKVLQHILDLGATSITVGGSYSYLQQTSDQDTNLPQKYIYHTGDYDSSRGTHAGCVAGFLYNTLQASENIITDGEMPYTVTLSPITYPDTFFGERTY